MKKIAIIRRNGLGDLLCAYPLINYLKKENEQNHITLFVDESNAPLVSYLPPVNEVVVFRKNANKYMEVLIKGWKERSKKFDVVISAKTSPMKLMNLLLFVLGGKERIAYVDNHWSSYLINHPIMYDPQMGSAKHQALKTLNMVAPHFKSIPKELYPRIQPPSHSSDSLILLLSASTTRPSSRLDISRYADIVNRWYRQLTPFTVRIISLPKDEVRAQALAAELQVPHTLHIPRGFDQFMRTIGECDIFFCGDGGICHLGAAMNKPSLVLFGETRPSEWGPLGEHVHTLYDPIHVNRLSDQQIFEKGLELFNAQGSV